MEKMFCFQCEQTAGGKGCTINGVCGKKGGTANLQDELTGVLIGLSRATIGNKNRPTSETDKIMIEGLFTTITN
ncbi:TPA: hydroxylamine reductase, partial [Clostridioides difficile]